MKLRIEREKALQAFAEVATVIPAKTPMQILKYARITTKGNRMKIEAGNSETAIVKYIDLAECDSDGVFLIDIADFNKLIASIKSPTMVITVTETEVCIEHASGSASYPAANPQDYPAPPMPSGQELIETTLDTKLLANAIGKGKSFISTDTLRPILCAIYAYINASTFGYCATDTHILIHGHESIAEEKELDWLIMPQAFTALLKNCQKTDTVKIQLTEDKSWVIYRFANTIIMTKQIVGIFPNFRRVIPSSWNIDCSVDRAALIDSLQRIKLLSNVSRLVKFDISRLDMTLTGDDMDFMKKGVEHITHNGSSGDIIIAANADNIRKCANVFTDGNITLHMTDASCPIVFVQNDDDNLQVICMPMHLLNE